MSVCVCVAWAVFVWVRGCVFHCTAAFRALLCCRVYTESYLPPAFLSRFFLPRWLCQLCLGPGAVPVWCTCKGYVVWL